MEQTKPAAPPAIILTSSRLWFDALAAHLPMPALHAVDANQFGQLMAKEPDALAITLGSNVVPISGAIHFSQPALPIRLSELRSRIANHSSARSPLPGYDPATGQLAVVRLTEKEKALLDALLNASSPLSRDHLLATIWRYDAGADTHTVETHLYRLRTKLETVFAGDVRIDTGDDGYRLVRA